ncbi:hypothetical protein [Hyphomicrobium sp. ghe19]|uniref:hypothetical protein n=1 Tax=Hyphomicrobium sp. ghe19 TaxID=2682968 RepID=UPI00136772CB|nr:hypothetical protein HYPP_01511 [Hyphomicrobium sp. ghe19]
MDLNASLAPIRPITQLLGKVLIIVGLAVFFGANIPFNHAWWEIGLAGWLLQGV